MRIARRVASAIAHAIGTVSFALMAMLSLGWPAVPHYRGDIELIPRWLEGYVERAALGSYRVTVHAAWSDWGVSLDHVARLLLVGIGLVLVFTVLGLRRARRSTVWLATSWLVIAVMVYFYSRSAQCMVESTGFPPLTYAKSCALHHVRIAWPVVAFGLQVVALAAWVGWGAKGRPVKDHRRRLATTLLLALAGVALVYNGMQPIISI